MAKFQGSFEYGGFFTEMFFGKEHDETSLRWCVAKSGVKLTKFDKIDFGCSQEDRPLSKHLTGMVFLRATSPQCV